MATVLPKTGRFFEIPFSKTGPSMIVTLVLSGVCVWANKALFNVPPASVSPGFIAEAAEKEGIAERIAAPAVYLDPISRGVPGNVRGPDDLSA